MYNEVIAFWFDEIEAEMWWKKDLEFDRLIESRFGDLHRSAAAGELVEWRTNALGSLAEVIVLDQFSRNIFRNQPQAFATDSVALVLAQTAIALNRSRSADRQARRSAGQAGSGTSPGVGK